MNAIQMKKKEEEFEIVTKTEDKSEIIKILDTQKSYVPRLESEFVPWGSYEMIEKVVNSNIFMPFYVTGLSGNGKTMTIMQACARNNRECLRVNLTRESDTHDLIGGIGIEKGSTVWKDGPVVTAMRRGAVLLLDEVDLASTNIMCLQSILEGRGTYIKETGEQVMPEKGFTIFATANTKGKGSDDGRFIGANVQNEAFLDRFKYTIEQPYPSYTTIVSPNTQQSGNGSEVFDGTFTYVRELENDKEKLLSEMSDEELARMKKDPKDTGFEFRLEEAIVMNAFLRITGYLDAPIEKRHEYTLPKEESTKCLEFIRALVELAHNNRKSFDDEDGSGEGMDEVITTRRLCSIIEAYHIFGDYKTAIELSISRFDDETKKSMLTMFQSIHGGFDETNK